MRSDWAKKENESIDDVLIPDKEKIYFLKEILSQIFEKFKGDSESLNTIFFKMICCSSWKPWVSNDGVSDGKDILEQLLVRANKKLNQEVGGAEKLIAAMLLLGYRDLHGGNLGIIRAEQENVEGDKIVESVYAKVDMSASFYNLHINSYSTNSLYYVIDLRKMLSVQLSRDGFSGGYHVKHDIDYIKLKEEINKACDLFIEHPAYITSLVHRALLYKKPLLKTEEESIVESFVSELIIQVKLLKEFANSEEFEELKGFIPKECYLGCQGNDLYRGESIIVELTRAVKANLVGSTVSTQKTLSIQDLESNSDQQCTQPKILTASCNPNNMVTESDNTKIPVSGQVNNIQGNSVQKSNPNAAASQNEKRSKLPGVAASALAIAGVALGVAIAVYLEMLAVGIAVGTICCLVAAAIIYCCNQPSKSLEKSSAQKVTPEELKTSCCT